MAQVHPPSKALSHRALEPAPSLVQRGEGRGPDHPPSSEYISLTIPVPQVSLSAGRLSLAPACVASRLPGGWQAGLGAGRGAAEVAATTCPNRNLREQRSGTVPEGSALPRQTCTTLCCNRFRSWRVPLLPSLHQEALAGTPLVREASFSVEDGRALSSPLLLSPWPQIKIFITFHWTEIQCLLCASQGSWDWVQGMRR